MKKKGKLEGYELKKSQKQEIFFTSFEIKTRTGSI